MGATGLGFASAATRLPPDQEAAFQAWYKQWARKAQIDPNPDDPRHHYDYRGAWKARVTPQIDKTDGRYHWPSQWKDDDHPNRFIMQNGRKYDTKYDRYVD